MRNFDLLTYKKWAPDNAKWTEWVKPVLFAVNYPYKYLIPIDSPKLQWILDVNYDTIIIVDLPGKMGVEEGLSLAKIGYRPIPLYNGVCGPNRESMIVDVYDIICALNSAANELESLCLRSNAPPAFLLDSNRMNWIGNKAGKFDNRWCIFPQDMPSASFLLKNGIRKVIVHTQKIQDDLAHILLRYQEKNIEIYKCGDDKIIKKKTISKPFKFKSMIYRFSVISGLTRNAAGGFGGKIPEPFSGGRYYGIG